MGAKGKQRRTREPGTSPKGAATRRQHAADEIRAFLRAGRLPAQLATEDGKLSIDGGLVTLPKPVWRPGPERDRFVDQLVMERFDEALLGAVAEHLGAEDLGLRAVRRDRGWVLHHDHKPLAVVCATHARVAVGPLIGGNFLRGGGHWRQLEQSVRRRLEARAQRGDDRHEPERQTFTAFPEGLEEAAAARALEASGQLRRDRNLVFEHAAVLDFGHVQLRFEPITTRGFALEVPLLFERDGASVKAALRLKTPADPLALVVEGDASDVDVGAVWVLALIGYAELTCQVPHVQRERRPSEASDSYEIRSMWRVAGSPAPRRLSIGGGGFELSPRLHPSPETWGLLASYVAGHRRRLQPGHRASDAARRAAASVGIDLRADETWVSPHSRGAPRDAVLRFRWEAPRVARELVA